MDKGREAALKAVVIGGGTGAPVSIRALISLGLEVSAVVAMADDGGSSGILREQAGLLPPGDIRKCLLAMASDPGSPWAKAFSRRLPYLDGHPLGNLMLSALGEVTGSLPEAITLCGELLGARGRVYPSTLESIELVGLTREGVRLEGQAMLTRSEAALASVALVPEQPQAYEEALQAISQADLIVLGPGSLFTSIIPNLLVPGVVEAISASAAAKVFLCSLADMQGETRGLDVAEHVEALLAHGDGLGLDIVVAHEPEPLPERWSHVRRVALDDAIRQRVEALGLKLVTGSLADPERPTWHDVGALAALVGRLLDGRQGGAGDVL